jgi:probable HAF family extracellular repeat protein
MMNTLKKQIILKRAGVVVAALCWPLCASARAPYTLVDLGVVGAAGAPNHITNNGVSVGVVEGAGGTDHAVMYFGQQMMDISKPGLGGANSEAVGNNAWSEVVGGANIRNVDPKREDFCGFQSLGIATATASCLPFLWQNSRMIALPTLDDNHGNNGVANAINDFGEVAGAAENTTMEKSCPTYKPALLQFQRYQFKPVVWRDHATEQLASVGGDPVGLAAAINNEGQAVGTTGTCAAFNLLMSSFISPLHAVLWEKDGTPIDLGSLGGNEQSLMGTGAKDLNSRGHVVGFSSLSDNVTFNAFLWTRGAGKMKDLVPLKGIANSIAIALNDSDEVVGSSINSTFTTMTATIWKHGVPADLNTLIPANSSLYLIFGCSINAHGEILGLATNLAGTVYHAYELIPAGQ